jgi:hypothetical protein
MPFLHLVVLYLVVERWRIPWSFRVWRGKNTPHQRLGKAAKSPGARCELIYLDAIATVLLYHP